MEHLLQRLAWATPLSDEEKRYLVGLSSDVRSFQPRDEIVSADEPVKFSTVLLEGLACREKVLASGQRQITAFHLSGDFCDLHTYMLKTIPDSVKAITGLQSGNRFSRSARCDYLGISSHRPLAMEINLD